MKVFVTHLDGKNTFLAGVFEGVAAAIHHPGEGRLYPGPSTDPVEWGCVEFLVFHGGSGDVSAEGLVDRYVVFVVAGADAAVVGW